MHWILDAGRLQNIGGQASAAIDGQRNLIFDFQVPVDSLVQGMDPPRIGKSLNKRYWRFSQPANAGSKQTHGTAQRAHINLVIFPQERKNPLPESVQRVFHGGGKRDRTDDLRNAIPKLYQHALNMWKPLEGQGYFVGSCR
jgi:hypothetical protein